MQARPWLEDSLENLLGTRDYMRGWKNIGSLSWAIYRRPIRWFGIGYIFSFKRNHTATYFWIRPGIGVPLDFASDFG
jgi:hypothetical protein